MRLVVADMRFIGKLVIAGAVMRALRLRRRVAVGLLLTVALAALAPAANAALTPGYGPLGSISMDQALMYSAGGGIAVDDATGNVLVVDPVRRRISVLAPDGGTSANYLTQIGGTEDVVPPIPTTGVFAYQTAQGSGQMQFPLFHVAVDQSTGAVYASDSTPALHRFLSDHASTPTYRVDPSFTSPEIGSGPGQVGDGGLALAVDPTSHELLVADRANGRVSRYTDSGAFVRSFDGSDTPGGAFAGPINIAAGSSTTYVVDATGNPFFPAFDPESTSFVDKPGTTRIERFDALGASLGSVNATDTPLAVAVARDRLLSVGNAGRHTTSRVTAYTGTERGAIGDFPGDVAGSGVAGAAVDGGPSSRRLYVAIGNFTGSGSNSIQVLTPGPGVERPAVSAVGPRTVHLAGAVNPDASQTSAHFEYSPDGTNWSATPSTDVGAGSSDVAISADVTGLRPNTAYSFRMAAANGQTGVTSPSTVVTTATEPPATLTGPVSDRAITSATLTGEITPYGLQTTYHFEYGDTSSYGQRAPARVEGVAGNGYASRVVAQAITGLQGGATYHYRLVASSAAGTSRGEDQTFTTRGDAAARGYEMVSPVDKGGVAVADISATFQARADGGAMVYATNGAMSAGEAAPRLPRYAATRDAGGWSTRPLDPPGLYSAVVASPVLTSVVAVSEDQTRALVVSRRKLTEGAVEDDTNIYIRDIKSGGYTLVATTHDPRVQSDLTTSATLGYVGGTPDFSSIAFGVRARLTPDAPGPDAQGRPVDTLYQWSASRGLRLASVLPSGASTASGGAAAYSHHQMSDDGSRLFFSTGGDDTGLYLRQDGEHTIPISVSQRPGDPATPHAADFLSASADGRHVMFKSHFDLAPLTPDAPGSEGPGDNVYRYDVVTGQLTYIASGVELVRRVSDDASSVFFESRSSMTPDATGSSIFLYFARRGTLQLVANLGGGDSGLESAGSPNGRYLAFASLATLTSYDNPNSPACLGRGPCKQLYLYDSETEQLSCASCRPNGGVTTGDASMHGAALGRYIPRSLLNDGELFFDSPEPLVSADVNGTRDVYAYAGGEPRLISRGKYNTVSTFADATPDASDVFFVTDDRLVGQDKDALPDVYDARIGGGLPSQSPGPDPAPCSGNGCDAPAPGPTDATPAATQAASGPTAKPAARAKAKVSVLKMSFTATVARLTVRVSDRGRIRASGRQVVATARSVARAGTYTLTVPLSRKARATRRGKRRVKFTVTVVLTPPFGSRVTTRPRRTLAPIRTATLKRTRGR